MISVHHTHHELRSASTYTRSTDVWRHCSHLMHNDLLTFQERAAKSQRATVSILPRVQKWWTQSHQCSYITHPDPLQPTHRLIHNDKCCSEHLHERDHILYKHILYTSIAVFNKTFYSLCMCKCMSLYGSNSIYIVYLYPQHWTKPSHKPFCICIFEISII